MKGTVVFKFAPPQGAASIVERGRAQALEHQAVRIAERGKSQALEVIRPQFSLQMKGTVVFKFAPPQGAASIVERGRAQALEHQAVRIAERGRSQALEVIRPQFSLWMKGTVVFEFAPPQGAASIVERGRAQAPEHPAV
jgi:hypothetical protein